jgi:heat shock protein HslJ
MEETMKSRRLAAALILAPLILVACSDDGGTSSGASTDPADLAGTWTLDAASLGSLAADASSGTNVTVVFADGQASGASGCNTFIGSYEATDDGSLKFGPLASTMMACEAPLMAVETAYLGALDKVSAFAVDGDLTLTGDDLTLSYASGSGS